MGFAVFTPNLTETTAELAASLLLAVNRRLVESERAVRSGEWGAWKPVGVAVLVFVFLPSRLSQVFCRFCICACALVCACFSGH